MTFIVISGFYPDSNSDNSIQYEKIVPTKLKPAVLAAMEWASSSDIPMGETDLTKDQAVAILSIFDESPADGLIYSVGLYA